MAVTGSVEMEHKEPTDSKNDAKLNGQFDFTVNYSNYDPSYYVVDGRLY